MELNREEYDNIIKYIKLAQNDSLIELECVLKKIISYSVFQDIIMLLDNDEDFDLEKVLNRESLDINVVDDNIRISLYNPSDIQLYCNDNIINNPVILQKESIQNVKNINIIEYDIYLKMKKETEILDKAIVSELIKTHYNSSKYYRYKKRFSYLHSSNVFRVDLTVVKTSRHNSNNLIQSGTMTQNEKFEIEIEFLNNSQSVSLHEDKCIEILFNIIEILLQVIDKTHNIMSNTNKNLILIEYLQLVSPKIITESKNDMVNYINTKILTNPKRYFLSYQPITLEKHNLLEPVLGNVSIHDNYTVTEKTDGERLLLYVSKNNNIYTIDTRLSIRDVGVKCKTANCIIDGEYVRRSKYGTIINKFMCFDIYFYDKEDTRNIELYGEKDSRLSLLEKFVAECQKNKQFNVLVKKFYYDENIYKTTKQAYNKDKYDYNIDGLIFTPKSLYVGSLYKKELSLKDQFSNTWNRVFKWKPPDENSIDMLVRYNEELFVPSIGKCVLAQLFVAYRINTENSVSPFKIINGDFKETSGYIKKSFGVVYLPITDNDKIPKSLSNEYIYNDYIVEFTFDKSKDEKLQWIPYRVRYDKTDLYVKTNNILNTANSYITAYNVWRSINYPVTLNHITGDSDIVISEEETNAAYYMRDMKRNMLLSKPMISFHSNIKSSLYKMFKNKNNRCLELACGKAGDLLKWIDSNFELVIGFDSNLDNIVNGNDGAYKRLNNFNIYPRNTKKIDNVLFLHKDLGKKWNTSDDSKNTELNTLNKIVWGNVDKNKIKNKKLHKFYGVMNFGFDLISCQFAIHYFFENDSILDNFVDNVSSTLKLGGYFIATCLNGNKTRNILNEKTKIEGKINDNTIWMLKKDPDDLLKDGTGQKISMYIESINRVYDEYIVDIDLLVSKFESKNIKPLIDEDLKKFDLKSSVISFEEYHKHNLVDVLKEFSFLNTVLIFKKY
jgi:hypothetical protein